MPNFEIIKQFFIDHIDRFVHYKVNTKEQVIQKKYLTENICKEIINNPKVIDFFTIEFPLDAPNGLISIDSLDSFVFDFYFLNLGDSIVISDAGRTFECGVEAFEGNGVLAEKIDLLKRYLSKNGMTYDCYNILKQTNIDTFIQDTITFIKVLQTLNNIQPFPPYLLELDQAKEVVDVLTRTWINNEIITNSNNSRTLALFDNHKGLINNAFCHEKSYPAFFNKHAFVGIFINENKQLLIRKNLKDKKPYYDFAINDFVLKDEFYSLEGLQRAIKENFGFDFFFGELAPVLTINKNKIITDYYIVENYNVSIDQMVFDNKEVSYKWIIKEELLDLIQSGDFKNYAPSFIEFALTPYLE